MQMPINSDLQYDEVMSVAEVFRLNLHCALLNDRKNLVKIHFQNSFEVIFIQEYSKLITGKHIIS